MASQKPQQSFSQKFKRFFAPVKNNYWFLIKPLLKSTWGSLFVIYTIETFKQATRLIQLHDYQTLLTITIIFGIVFLLTTTISYFIKHIGWATMAYEGPKLLQNSVMPEFFRLDNTEVEKLGTGKLIEIVGSGFKIWNNMFQDITRMIPVFCIIGTYSFIQIKNTGGIFAIGMFVCIIFLSFFVRYINKGAIIWRKQRNTLEADYSRQLVKMLMSKMEIVQNDKISFEIQKANDILSETTTKNLKVSQRLWLMFAPTNWLSQILKIAILVYGGYMLKTGLTDFSQFVGLVAIIGIFESKTGEFVEFYKDFTNNFSQVQRLWDTLDDTKRMRKGTKNTKFIYKKGDIKIQNLTFGYTKNSLVFDDFSVHISGGKKTAFVGASGSGKTTLIKLIASYIHADTGELFIDKQNLSEVNINDYYRHIGYLTQDPSVFDGSVYENLTYALKSVPTKEQLDTAIKNAKCEFLLEFEHGLETEIGERGIRLSGGQKQRLAIAKIMLKNPDIILLDEPTSALDSFNEEQINIALRNLFDGKTVIIVAHRLQTVKQADKILLFEEGKILEDGTHDELVALGGKYKKMLDLQSGF